MGEGEFCGAYYRQDPDTKGISMSQQQFAESMRSAAIPKGAENQALLTESQVRLLRGKTVASTGFLLNLDLILQSRQV